MDLLTALNDFVMNKKKPLLGICVGLQMFADVGYEETETKGLGWISGKVTKINNQNGKYKLPHIGWNQINILKESKIFKDIKDKSHMYFVHSYEFVPVDKNLLQQQLIIHQIMFALLKKKIFLALNFILKKVIKLD